MEPISQRYLPLIKEMMKNSRQRCTVTENDVYQIANPINREYIDKMVADLLLPGSGIINIENLEKLYEYARAGKSCLILMDHFSNFDLPCLHFLLEKEGPKGKEIADSIVAIAGMKLNEESPVVLAFTEAFTRIVIYPSRSMNSITDPAMIEEEKRKSKAINRAAMHHLVRVKNTGHIVLVFPAGTRYRPWDPSTGRGLKEIDSYIKSFDYMVLVSITGNILRIVPDQAMHEDLAAEDVVAINISPVIECESFRELHKARAPEGEDPKQFVVDRLMEDLSDLHTQTEILRTNRMNASAR